MFQYQPCENQHGRNECEHDSKSHQSGHWCSVLFQRGMVSTPLRRMLQRVRSKGNQYFSSRWVFFFNFKESLFCFLGYEISLIPVSIVFPSCSKSWGGLLLFLVHNLVLWFRRLSEEDRGPHLSYQEGRRTAPTTNKLDRSWVCS